MEFVVRIDISIRRPVQLLGVALERMCAELLDENTNRGRQPLRPQNVAIMGLAVDGGTWRQAVKDPCLVAGDQRVGTEDRCSGAGKYGYARAVWLESGHGLKSVNVTGRFHWP